MTFFSDVRETSSLFNDNIEEVRSFFRANQIDFGTPFDLPIFTKILKNDLRLRVDLAVLARSIMERQNNLSLRKILTIIAIASGGPDIADSDIDLSQSTNLLADFLIRVGGCNPASADNPDIPCSESTTQRLEEAALVVPPPSSHETQPPTADGAAQTRFQDQMPPSDVGNPFTESLTRLELNALQMKHYLDSIDQRIGRIEPRLDSLQPQSLQPQSGLQTHSGLEAQPAPAAVHQPHHVPEFRYSAAIPSENPPPQPQSEPRLDSLEPPPGLQPQLGLQTHPGPEAHPTPAAVHQPHHMPEFRYSAAIASENPAPQSQNEPHQIAPPPIRLTKQSEIPPPQDEDSFHLPAANQSAIPVTAGLAALAIVLASLSYWGFHRNTPSITIGPTTPAIADAATVPPSSTAPMSVSDVNHSRPSEITRAVEPQSNSATGNLAGTTNNHSSNKPSPLRLGALPPSSSASETPARATGEASTELPPLSSSATSERSNYSSPAAIQRINVSSGVMAANVLSSPQPSYPKLASLTRMQGEVVMQAIISKEGAIEDVRVIKGHRLLRSAATNAVRSWRYRPFLIDGHPVEVATIVTVDFKLPR